LPSPKQEGKAVEIEMLADPAQLRQLDQTFDA
jgi:hypothetical protein